MGFSLTGLDGALDHNPFFRVRLDRQQLAALAKQLRICASRHRRWFTLAATYENPARLRLVKYPTPDFETGAATAYIRGEILRVTGKERRSCNITFSSLGAEQLVRGIEEARRRMRASVEMMADRRHGMVEFVPDVERGTRGGEGDLAAALEAESSAAMPPDDFSDWERSE